MIAMFALFHWFALLLTQQTTNAIPGVLDAGVQAELVRENFVFTEGPVGTADGGLFFSDNRANIIYKMDANGAISVFREHTNGGNGLALTRKGELLVTEGDGKRISRIAPNGESIPLEESGAAGPLLAPNDLIVDSKGGIYFTDPGPRPVVPDRKVFVYYLPSGARQPVVIDDQIARPNGLTLTNDGKTLIVDDTLGETVYAYDIQGTGKVSNKRVFARLNNIPPSQESGADGMAIDRQGHLFVSTVTGVQVFDERGDYLGTIRVPRQPANVAFSGPDKRTLYITAREGLYRIQTLTQGPARPGK